METLTTYYVSFIVGYHGWMPMETRVAVQASNKADAIEKVLADPRLRSLRRDEITGCGI